MIFPETYCRYEDANLKTGGKLWVKFPNGHEAPIDVIPTQEGIAALGYKRENEAKHIKVLGHR